MRCEDELRRLKRLPATAELTFDQEEEMRRSETRRLREDNARMMEQLAAFSEAVRMAALDAYVCPSPL